MSTKNIIEIILSAKDKASPVLAESEKKLNAKVETYKKIGIAASAAGAVILAGMKVAVSSTTDFANQVDKMSKTTGIGTESISKLGYAAIQEHASMELLAGGLKYLARNLNDTANGTGEAKEAFERLKVEPTDLNGRLRKTDEVLLEIADKFMNMTNETEKSALAMKIFGRSGVELVPFLNMGKEEIMKLGEEAQRLGYVLSKDNVAAFKKYQDTIDATKAGMAGLKITVATAVLPAFQMVVKGVQTGFEWFQKLPAPLKDNTIKLIGLAGAVLGVIGPMALFYSWALKIQLWTKIQTLLTNAYNGAVKAATAAQHGLNLALKANPIGLVITAVGLLVAGLIYLYKTNDTARYYMQQAWSSIKIAVASAIDYILEKLQSLTKFIPGMAEKIQAYRDQLSEVVDNAAAEKNMREFAHNYQGMGSFRKAEADQIAAAEEKSAKRTENALEDVISAQEKAAEAAQKAKEKQVSTLNSLYDSLKSALKKQYDFQERIQTEALDKELSNARKATDEKLALYDKEYRAKIKSLDVEAAAAIEQIEKQIETINSQTEAEEKAQQEREYQQKIASLQIKLQAETDAQEKAKIQQELNDEIAAQERRRVLDARTAQKDALRDEIARIRQQVTDKKDLLQQEYDDKKAAEQSLLQATENRLATEKTKIEEHYDKLEEEAAIAAEAQKLIWGKNQTEILALLKTYEPDWVNQGKSFGEKLLEGFKSVSMESMLSGILSGIPGSIKSGGAGGGGTSGNSGLNADAQYIENTFPGGLSAYVADLNARAAAGTEPNIQARVETEKIRIGVAHSGGVITKDGVVPFPALKDGEVPIVAQDGETIFPKGGFPRAAGAGMMYYMPITITGNTFFGERDFERKVEAAMDRIIRKLPKKWQ